VLIVEDSRDDALLIERELRRAGYEPHTALVEAPPALQEALERPWDLVLSDFSLPGFDAMGALRLVRARAPDVPFVIVSGTITDAMAGEAMRAGASDYVLKDNLGRLAPVVRRVLIEAAARREQRHVREELEALRERTATEVRRSRDELEVVLRGVAEGVLAEDEHGGVVYANDAALAAFGLRERPARSPAERALERFEFSDDAGRVLAAGELPTAVALRTRAALETLLCRRERRSREERWFRVSATPRYDGARDAWIAITILRDVTERRRTEAGLRCLSEASRALAASLDHASTLAAFAWAPVPHVADWCVVDLCDDDQREHLRRAAGTLSTASVVRDLQALDDVPGAQIFGTPAPPRGRPAMFPELDGAAPRPASEAHRRVLDAIGPASVVVVPIFEHREQVGTMSLAFAESGRRYTDDDLPLVEELARRGGLALENARLFRMTREAVAARDEFLSVAAHELRTPLTTLVLQSDRMQLMRRSMAPGDPCAALLDGFESLPRQVRRMAGLVENLLDVSRIAVGRFALQREPLDLAAFVLDEVGRTGEEAHMAGCAVTLDAPGPVRGEWDRLRLGQIVANLLSNAFKYGTGKPVEVRVDEQAGSARLTVRDHGIGIAAADVERIFDRFERAVSARNFGGLGLGLFVVRQLVQAHGGSIRVESEPEEGSTFTVLLPRGAGAEAGAGDEAPSAPGP